MATIRPPTVVIRATFIPPATRVEHRCDSDEEGYPGETAFKLSHLNRTVGCNGLLNFLYALVVAEQTLVENRCYRTACVAANVFSSFYSTVVESVLNFLKELFCVGAGEVEVDNPLDCNSKTEYEAGDDGGHEAGATLDEEPLDFLMHGSLSRGLLCCSLGYGLEGYQFRRISSSERVPVLRRCVLCSESHETHNCQKHEEFFHTIFD